MSAAPAPPPAPHRILLPEVEIPPQAAWIAAEPRRMRRHRTWHIPCAEHHRTSRAHNAGLLPTDAIAVVAEPIRMVKLNVGQHGHVRIQNIDRIQTPAHSDFEQPDIALGGLKEIERGQRAKL